ncbi:hypothetical protein [Niabella ginsengisoli]|uniref:Macro domain-containing protein n=1 Tax=Niabella ginsengisoli TaxID=522298 RepID=A0ABS9SHF9_9BACT|nr:hypothetical protein [Niabella ginsengisoli]MCH5597808.1 hypothetical protein [Niabella ginsengisoli]
MQPDSTHSGWSLVTDPALHNFSEVAYFFAKQLSSKLKAPVGIISAAIPGSGIEPWMPKEALLKEIFFKIRKAIQLEASVTMRVNFIQP